MKHQLIATLAGLTVATFVSMPMEAQAQQHHSDLFERRQEVVETLNLTEQQQQLIAAIRSDTRSQLRDLLTPEQRQILREGIGQAQPLPSMVDELDFSPEQRSQALSILQASREQLSAILTDEQRQQLREELRARFTRLNRNRNR
ncbi:MAG: hypothetical protein ACFE0J_11450 [Elainellaceae cyanobacterium]